MAEAPLRKIVIVNTADQGGGAETMSMAMLDGLNALGVDTWLLVGTKKTNHPRVLPFYASPFLDYRKAVPTLKGRALDWRRWVERQIGLESFSHRYSNLVRELTGSPPDLVLCHNLHGGFFDLRALPPLSRQVPVVLRLFDSWLFTGHCAVPRSCDRWLTGCGRCPDLAAPPEITRDATRYNWRRKQKILAGGRYFVSTESDWMLCQAKQSFLKPLILDWKQVRGGVDLETFSPGSKRQARSVLRLPVDEDIVLVVVNLGLENPTKNYSNALRALEILGRSALSRPLTVLVAGADRPPLQIGPGITVRHLGFVADRNRMSALLRASDALIHSSIGETFGLAVAEALACGTPCIVASTGGVRELVAHQRTGMVLSADDPAALAHGIRIALANPLGRAEMGRAGADFARSHLDGQVMVRQLLAWFREIRVKWPDAGIQVSTPERYCSSLPEQ